MITALMDNDVLLKGSCYGFLDELLSCVPGAPHRYGILGAARYVLRKAVRRRPPVADRGREALEAALERYDVIEPTQAELRLAAELEYEAQRAQLSLHEGECLLCAILVTRELHHLVTGDRQAIEALPYLPAGALDLEALNGKLVCLEQAVSWLVRKVGGAQVRAHICAEPGVDVALRVCFSCTSPEVDEASFLPALEQYVCRTRQLAAHLMMADP